MKGLARLQSHRPLPGCCEFLAWPLSTAFSIRFSGRCARANQSNTGRPFPSASCNQKRRFSFQTAATARAPTTRPYAFVAPKIANSIRMQPVRPVPATIRTLNSSPHFSHNRRCIGNCANRPFSRGKFGCTCQNRTPAACSRFRRSRRCNLFRRRI